MKLVERREILDYVTYEDVRAAFRADVLRVKTVRRIFIGEYFTLLCENHTTVRYQIQEMIRAERIVRESDVLHEIETYNELLGKNGEIGCTLLIEIEDPALRNQKLQEWWRLPERIYVLMDDGIRIPATFDERQRGDGRLSSVQYLQFDTQGRVPIAVGIDLDNLWLETPLTAGQKEALKNDLAE